MQIPEYQIYNVLNAFASRLCGREPATPEDGKGIKAVIDSIKLSAKGKRQTIIDRVAAEIVTRISRFGTQETADDPSDVATDPDTPRRVQSKSETLFVFNVVDSSNQKKTHKISAADHRFIIEQLEQRAKEAAGEIIDI